MKSHAAVVFVATSFGIGCQWPAWSETPLYAGANVVVVAAMVWMAATCWRRGLRPLAIGCALGGVFWILQWLTMYDSAALVIFGMTAGILAYTVLCLGFISVKGPTEKQRLPVRLLDAAIACTSIAQVALLVITRSEWCEFPVGVWTPPVSVDYETFSMAANVLGILWSIIALTLSYVAIRRLMGFKLLDRAAVGPVVAGFTFWGLVSGPVMIGLALLGVASESTSGMQPFTPPHQNLFYFALTATIAIIPASFVVSAMLEKTANIKLLRRLNAELARGLNRSSTAHSLAPILEGIPARLLLWSEDQGSYVNGSSVDQNHGLHIDKRCSSRVISHDSSPYGLLVTGCTVIDHSAISSFIAHSVATAIKSADLRASVQDQLQLHDSVECEIAVAVEGEKTKASAAIERCFVERFQRIEEHLLLIGSDSSTNVSLASIRTELDQSLQSLHKFAAELAADNDPPRDAK